MADIPQPPLPPGVPGAPVTPMKKSTGKVQPKKETVRITLPPKPSAAPTIKLPTLPPGGPTGAPAASLLPHLRRLDQPLAPLRSLHNALPQPRQSHPVDNRPRAPRQCNVLSLRPLLSP